MAFGVSDSGTVDRFCLIVLLSSLFISQEKIMGTKTKCSYGHETIKDFSDFPSFTLCKITTKTSARVHIGFFTSERKEFMVLCGSIGNYLCYNPVSVYDINTLREITEPLTIAFN